MSCSISIAFFLPHTISIKQHFPFAVDTADSYASKSYSVSLKILNGTFKIFNETHYETTFAANAQKDSA